MDSFDAVWRLEGPGSNIDRAVGDNRLRAKYEAEWFAVPVGERTEEGAERALEHHQLAIIGNVVHNTVGDSDSGFGFPPAFRSSTGTHRFAHRRPTIRTAGLRH